MSDCLSRWLSVELFVRFTLPVSYVEREKKTVKNKQKKIKGMEKIKTSYIAREPDGMKMGLVWLKVKISDRWTKKNSVEEK